VRESREVCTTNIEEVAKALKKRKHTNIKPNGTGVGKQLPDLPPAGPCHVPTGGPTGGQRCDPQVSVSPGMLGRRRSAAWPLVNRHTPAGRWMHPVATWCRQ